MAKKLSKYFIIFLLTVLLIVIVSKGSKRTSFNDKVYNVLVGLNLINNKTCDSDDLDLYLSQEGFDFEKENKKIIKDSLNKLYAETPKEINLKIPAITHRVYFSSPRSKKNPKELYLEFYKSTVNKLNLLPETWQHNVWTNLPDIFPEEIKKLKGVQIRNISDLKGHYLYDTLVNIIKKGDKLVGHFSEASDLLRFMVVQKYGGIYMDMDYEIYNTNALHNWMHNFNFLGIIGIKRYYETAFIAASPNHPILNKALELEARNNDLDTGAEKPYCIKYPVDEYRKIYFSAPPLLTVAIVSEYNKQGTEDLLLPHWIAMNPALAQYKNGSCDKTNEVSKDDFIKSEQNLKSIIKEFTEITKVYSNPVYDAFKPFKPYQENIYYDPKYFGDFEVLGADMSCGTWAQEKQGFNRIYYWQWPFSKKEQLIKATKN